MLEAAIFEGAIERLLLQSYDPESSGSHLEGSRSIPKV